MSNRTARMDSGRRTESNGLKIGQIRHPELPQWAQEILTVDLEINGLERATSPRPRRPHAPKPAKDASRPLIFDRTAEIRALARGRRDKARAWRNG
jgi:hypothetical protein